MPFRQCLNTVLKKRQKHDSMSLLAKKGDKLIFQTRAHKTGVPHCYWRWMEFCKQPNQRIKIPIRFKQLYVSFFEILFKCWQVVLWSSAIWPWNSESTAKKVIYFWMVFLFLHVKPNLGIRNFSLAYCVTLSKKNVAVPFAFSIRDFQYFRPQPLVVYNIVAMMGK